MTFYDVSAQLLFQSTGQCKLNVLPEYVQYTKENWEQVVKFCLPYSIEKTRRGRSKGRTVVDLPFGNTVFEYGMILVKLGKSRLIICTEKEFKELFYIPI